MRKTALIVSVVAVSCSGTNQMPSASKNHYFDVIAGTGTFSLTGNESGECTGTTSASSASLTLPATATRAYYFFDGTDAEVGGGVRLDVTYAAPQGTDSCGACTQGTASSSVLFDLSSLETLGDNPGADADVTPVFGAMTDGQLPQPCGGSYALDAGWLQGEPLSIAAFRSSAFSIEKSGSVMVRGSGLSTFEGTLTYSFKLDLQASRD